MGTPWPVLAWAYWGAACVLALVALCLLARGLWRDKGANTRRCPKCWYEMTGVPGLKCPECGREARTEKSLFQRRRSRWWAGLAAPLLLLSCGLGVWPKVDRDGWWAVTPDTVLILMWPQWAPASVAPAPPGPPPPPGTVFVPISVASAGLLDARSAILERLGSATLWNWQKRWLGDRCLQTMADQSDPTDVANARDLLRRHGRCSPAMRPVVLRLIARELTSQGSISLLSPIYTLAPMLERLNAAADDRGLVARAAAASSRTESIIRQYLHLAAEGTIDSTALSALAAFIKRNIHLCPDSLIEGMAQVAGPEIAEALTLQIDVSPIRAVDSRTRRVCSLLGRIGKAANPFPIDAARRVKVVPTIGLPGGHRALFVALFILAPTSSQAADGLVLQGDQDDWGDLWKRVLVAEADGDRAGVYTTLRSAILHGETTSIRLEALRMAAFLNLGQDEPVVAAIEGVARGDSAFLGQYAVLTLIDLQPAHPLARAALERLKVSGLPDIDQWVTNGRMSMRQSGRPPY